MPYYTGIGSRRTPNDIQAKMANLANLLASKEFNLYSGAAEGADKAFERGVANYYASNTNETRILAYIFIPWEGFASPFASACMKYYVPDDSKFDEAAEILEGTGILPWFTNMAFGAKKLHARNVWQVLGFSPESRSSFVLYWTPGDPSGGPTGGTRTAVLLAQKNGIPTYHLGSEQQMADFKARWL